MYVQLNIEVLSCKHYYSRKAKFYIFYVCVCSVSYPACNAHAPYCHLWPVRLFKMFSHYLIKGTIFEKKVTEYNVCILTFSINSVSKFLIPRRTERDMIKNIYIVYIVYIDLQENCPLFLSDFNET